MCSWVIHIVYLYHYEYFKSNLDDNIRKDLVPLRLFVRFSIIDIEINKHKGYGQQNLNMFRLNELLKL